MKYFFFCISFLFCLATYGQDVVIFGVITDAETGIPIDFATVYVEGTSTAAESNDRGEYRIEVAADTRLTLVFTRIGYTDASAKLPSMTADSKRYMNIKLAVKSSDFEVIVTESRIEDIGMVREEVQEMLTLPSVSGNLESVLPSIALGTSSGTGGELSSQYNVRGGNYDENLVYVNDFEIFRPQLIRTGQQEGLTFPNIDLVRDLSFSSGGFEAKYGDKLSSVLDISYKRPEEMKGSVGMSLLGSSAHIEGSKRLGPNAYNKFRYLVGARYKTTRYILGTLDTKGEYLPDFTDVQAYLTYDLSRSLQVALLANYNNSIYNFTPTERSTTLGLLTQAFRFTSVFEGGERNRFTNGTQGLSLSYVPERKSNPMYLKFLAANYTSSEEENFDILGFYRLSEVETGLGSDDFGEEVSVLGVGTQHSSTRNYLFNTIQNIAHKGGIELQNKNSDAEVDAYFLQWGVKYQRESFDDRLNEWERIDSAGFSLPLDSTSLEFNYVLKTENSVAVNKLSGFVQNAYNIRRNGQYELKLTAGARLSYRDLSDELLFSPRFQILYKPLSVNQNIAFKLSGGVYYQQPFYREMRRLDGTINTNLRSQKSTHLVAGMAYDFPWTRLSNKPFKLITELYYKQLEDLVSYEIDNVRIRYSGENDGDGYAAGFDIRVNGEFVPGAESWVNLSFLRARERLDGVQHLVANFENPDEPTEVSFVPRPTDQFMTLSMFFQDYLPSNQNIKMFLNMAVGTGLPFGIKDNNTVFRNTFRFKPYHRVDIGFGFQLWKEEWRKRKPKHPLRFSRNTWFNIEVFNLLEVANVANNTWIKTVTNNQFAIPNFLTSRRINLRFRVEI